MTKLLIVCPTCNHEAKVSTSALGKRGRCAVCGTAFEVTRENAAPIDEAPAAAPSGQTTVPRRALPAVTSRIASMDHLRGYAIFGMILVDALGNFDVFPGFLHHHKNAYSYADTIAPLFVFVVGMGFRLSMARRVEKEGVWAARWGALKRYFTLFIVAIAFYGPNYRIDWWDALTDIALAGIITLPLINQGTIVRAVAAWFYLALYMAIFLATPYGTWLYHNSMNGGPLGMLCSGFALLMGTVAYDLLDSGEQKEIVRWSLIAGLGMVLLSFVVWKLLPATLEPYTTEQGAYWAFAARWKAAPVELMSVGLAWIAFLAFFLACDVYEKQIPMLPILGENPLVIYLIQYSLFEMNGGYIEQTNTSADYLYGIFLFAGVLAFCYAAALRLHKQGYIIKL